MTLALVAVTLDADTPRIILDHREGEHRLPRAPLDTLVYPLEDHLVRTLIGPLGLETDPVLQVRAVKDTAPDSLTIAYAGLVAHRFLNAAGFSWHALTDLLPGEGAAVRDEDFDPTDVVGRLAEGPADCPMPALDRTLLAESLGVLRQRLTTWPVLSRLTPPTFTLTYLQRSVEALLGIRLRAQNFRRLVLEAGLVTPVGLSVLQTTGRPAALYRFDPQPKSPLRDSLLHAARA